MHSTMKQFAAILLALSLALAAPAQTNLTAAATNLNVRAMSLQDCLQEALAHNFDIQVQRLNPEIAHYNLRAAYGGYDPALNFSGQHQFNVQPGGFTSQGIPYPPSTSRADSFNSGINGTTPWGLQYGFTGNAGETTALGTPSLDRSSAGQIEMSLTQPLLKDLWIDSTRLTIRLDKNLLKSAVQGLRLQMITSITAVETAYYELVFALDNVGVEKEALNLAQTQLDQDNQRVQIGTLAILDVQQDEAQVAQSQANLIAAQYTLVLDQNTLKNLLTDTNYLRWHDTDIQPTAPLIAPPQSFDLQESWRRGMTERPDLLQAQLTAENQGIQLKFDRNQIFPQLNLIGTYGFNGAGGAFDTTFNQFNQGNAPFYSYGAQLSVPLSNIGARNTYKSAKVTLQQYLLQLKQLEQNVMVEIDNAVKEAQSDYQAVQASRQARIYAEAALDAEQKKYAVGKSTTFTVLQLQNNLTAARSQEIRALANYNEALATLAQQEGSTLERNNINVQAK